MLTMALLHFCLDIGLVNFLFNLETNPVSGFPNCSGVRFDFDETGYSLHFFFLRCHHFLVTFLHSPQNVKYTIDYVRSKCKKLTRMCLNSAKYNRPSCREKFCTSCISIESEVEGVGGKNSCLI